MKYDIVIATKGSDLFDKADQFCTEKYWARNMLKPGYPFKEKFDNYFMILNKKGNPKITFAAKTDPVPCKNHFTDIPKKLIEQPTVEIGRYAYMDCEKSMNIVTITKILFSYLVFFHNNNNHLESHNFLIETNKLVVNFIRFAFKTKGIKLISNKLIPENIPPQSRDYFLKANLCLYQIESAVLWAALEYAYENHVFSRAQYL